MFLLERANTNYIVKFNLRSGKEEAQIRISDYTPRKNAYAWNGYSGVDLAVDENGLWVLWGSTGNSYRLYASKINVQKNSITHTWSLDTGMSTINRFLRSILKMKQQQHDINLRRTRKKNPSPRWDLNPRPSVI